MMKKSFIFASLLFCSSVAFGSNLITNNLTNETRKEAITVTINISSNGSPVKGALIRITSDGMPIGSSASDDFGKATISIPTYGNQFVQIQIIHSLYKDQKMSDVVLVNGKNFDFILKNKTETVDEITNESVEKINKIEEKTVKSEEKTTQHEKDAEKYSTEKEESAKYQEQLSKEKEEAVRLAEEKNKLAELKKAEAEKKQIEADKKLEEAQKSKEQNGTQVADDAKKREAEAKQREISVRASKSFRKLET